MIADRPVIPHIIMLNKREWCLFQASDTDNFGINGLIYRCLNMSMPAFIELWGNTHTQSGQCTVVNRDVDMCLPITVYDIGYNKT